LTVERVSQLKLVISNYSIKTLFNGPLKNLNIEFNDIAFQVSKTSGLAGMKESTITFISAYFDQFWLQPIIDYSISPQHIFQPIPAHDLQKKLYQGSIQSDQIVIIAAGGQDSNGKGINGDDTYPLPRATQYWRSHGALSVDLTKLTGGEALAYATYHFQNRDFLVPIPDLWMLLIAGLCGKALQVTSSTKPRGLVGVIVLIAYALLTLQVYISLRLLIPFLLPSTIWLSYFLSLTRRKNNA
jgi:hypothetical protein